VSSSIILINFGVGNLVIQLLSHTFTNAINAVDFYKAKLKKTYEISFILKLFLKIN
jgi:hypothetical protein